MEQKNLQQQWLRPPASIIHVENISIQETTRERERGQTDLRGNPFYGFYENIPAE